MENFNQNEIEKLSEANRSALYAFETRLISLENNNRRMATQQQQILHHVSSIDKNVSSIRESQMQMEKDQKILLSRMNQFMALAGAMGQSGSIGTAI